MSDENKEEVYVALPDGSIGTIEDYKEYDRD